MDIRLKNLTSTSSVMITAHHGWCLVILEFDGLWRCPSLDDETFDVDGKECIHIIGVDIT